ncbi:PAS domain-containing protein [Haloarcula brevis]|uniref:PAS domain-containing protein n=1 Tax=Haloarcula brevis TaxID=3111453 RepID=UPI00300EB51A
MIGNDLDDIAFAGGGHADATGREFEVVYLDTDPAARQRVRTALSDHSADATVTTVATTTAALEAVASTEVACLALDPAGLDDIPAALVSNDRYPVVVYTDGDDAVVDDAATVVKKQRGEQSTFLAEKVVSVVSASADRTESALRESLSGIESRAGADEIAVLLGSDGEVRWSNAAVSAFVAGMDDTRRVDRLYDAMATAVPDTPCGRRQVQRLRDAPTEPVTVRLPGDDHDQYLLRHGYELPDAAGGLTLVLLRDVTETARRDARTALLDLLVDQAQDGLYTLDERGVIDFCNESFAATLGYDPAELRGEHASAVLVPGELSKGQATVERLLESPAETSTTVDLTFRRKDGTERELSINYTLIHDDVGNYDGLVGVARDVTERKHREREYQELTERLHFALEGAELGVWDWNPKTNEVTFDERWTGMLGYTTDELEPRYETWADLVHPDDIDRAEQALKDLKTGETELYQCEFRMRTKDGDWRWIRDIGKVFERTDDGEAVRAVGIHQDITEERRRQNEVERQRDELVTLDRVNVLIQDLIHALGTTASRDEIAETVCERIVDSELWSLAWIGERTGASDGLVPETVAGADDRVDVATDWADPGPGETALRTGTPQTATAESGAAASSGDATPAADGAESVAAVPLVHGDVVHGILCVCAAEPDAFTSRVVESFAVLGEMIGFAFTAVQNRRLLTRDRVLELTFESRNPETPLVSVSNAYNCRVEVVESVDIGSNHLLYLSVDGGPAAAVAERLGSRAAVVDSRVVRADDDGGTIELRVPETIQSLLLDVGACRRTVVADGGTLSITIEAPPDADSRTIRETLTTLVPDLTLTAKRECERARDAVAADTDPSENLTDRQQEVLRTAFLTGYYAWPRDTDAEQLAEALGIASPTLHQHLRRAQRNLVEAVFDFQ